MRELAALLEQQAEPTETMDKALALMGKRFGIKRAAISEILPWNDKIRITSAWGLLPTQIDAGEYDQGEGITGNVMASGKSICISDISQEPLFLNRTKSRNLRRENLSFTCVPIKFKGEILGAIWIDEVKVIPDSLVEGSKFLQIVAAMLAPLLFSKESFRRCRNNSEAEFGGFIGKSEAMRKIFTQIGQVAASRATVFLDGESGTGKELAARAIHEGSDRANNPFISMNCAALPENLIESELFGHERGAFTGASAMRKGKFELAHHGTLFLDEIGEMNLSSQAKLLRVLQEHVVERVGSCHPIAVDVRIITATNRNLEAMVQAGQFRQDLYYRLNVFPIHMPALRERREDIPDLARHFLWQQIKESNRGAAGISSSVLQIFNNYDWPGNIRELQNVIERAFLLLEPGEKILPRHLPENLLEAAEAMGNEQGEKNVLRDQLGEIEKNAIIEALKANHGHIGKSARSLGLTERIFSLRLKRYTINYREYRSPQTKLKTLPDLEAGISASSPDTPNSLTPRKRWD